MAYEHLARTLPENTLRAVDTALDKSLAAVLAFAVANGTTEAEVHAIHAMLSGAFDVAPGAARVRLVEQLRAIFSAGR